MAARKVTVKLAGEQVDAIRKLVDSGGAQSVSGFVQHAVSVALDNVAGWGVLLADAICARRAHQRVVTSDPEDLTRLDPTLDVVPM